MPAKRSSSPKGEHSLISFEGEYSEGGGDTKSLDTSNDNADVDLGEKGIGVEQSFRGKGWGRKVIGNPDGDPAVCTAFVPTGEEQGVDAREGGRDGVGNGSATKLENRDKESVSRVVDGPCGDGLE